MRPMQNLLPICGLLAGTFGANQIALSQSYDRNSYLGEAPPEIVSAPEHWMGAAEPLTLEKLKGKVVWLHFNF